MVSELAWTCSVCDKIHRGLPSLATEAPAHYYSVPEAERPDRVRLTSDICVIDRKAFYVRGVFEIPIIDQKVALEFGVWVSLSDTNFARYQASFEDDDQSKLGCMFGWFASSLPGYDGSLNLRCNVVPQDNRQRPLIIFNPDDDHPLIADIKNGISLERAIEFVTPSFHRH